MPFDPRVHVGVAVAIINPLKHMLVIQRKGAHGHGQWALPGGWVDFGETPEETAIREMAEEVDLHLRPERLVLMDVIASTWDPPVDTSITILYGYPFAQEILEPKILEDEKISAMVWATYEELLRQDLFAPLNTALSRDNLLTRALTYTG